MAIEILPEKLVVLRHLYNYPDIILLAWRGSILFNGSPIGEDDAKNLVRNALLTREYRLIYGESLIFDIWNFDTDLYPAV